MADDLDAAIDDELKRRERARRVAPSLSRTDLPEEVHSREPQAAAADTSSVDNEGFWERLKRRLGMRATPSPSPSPSTTAGDQATALRKKD